MSKFAKTLVAASIAAASFGSSSAFAEVSANIGVTSNYIWRGVTQSDDGSAVSGGLDYAHESGFYAGTWASTVDFGAGADNNEIEHDVYLGYGGEAAGIGYDLGLAHYMYPLTDDADFTELYVSGSYEMFTVGLAYTVSSDIDDTAGNDGMFLEGDLYYYASAAFDLGNDFGLGVTVGQYTFDDDGVAGTDLDYGHYQVAVTKAAGDFGDFTFAIDKNDIDGVTNGKEDDDARVSVSWSKSF